MSVEPRAFFLAIGDECVMSEIEKELQVNAATTVERTAELYGMSLMATYAAIKRGEIEAFRVGRRWIVPTAGLRKKLGMASSAKPELA
jgi:hypothetical protein